MCSSEFHSAQISGMKWKEVISTQHLSRADRSLGCPSQPPALQTCTCTAFGHLGKAEKPCKGWQLPASDQKSLTGTEIIHLEWVEGKGRHVTENGVSK